MTCKAVVSLSGGMDSTTVLGQVLERYLPEEVLTVAFHYGSKHGQWEQEAAKNVAEHYGVEHRQVDISAAFAGFQSNLLQRGGPIPEGHYDDASMAQTVVPGRNLVFLSLLAGLAASINCRYVWLGIHAGDHNVYEDCRPDFFGAMNRAVMLGVKLVGDRSVGVELVAPFLHMKKQEVLMKGLCLSKPVPYHLTRTCYKDQAIACSVCGSCQERLEAFALCGQQDPLGYHSRVLLPKR